MHVTLHLFIEICIHTYIVVTNYCMCIAISSMDEQSTTRAANQIATKTCYMQLYVEGLQ